MKYLDLTLPDPASNLACDEALLEMFETSGRSDALLRTWQSKSYFIVLGHANRIDSEIDLATCESEQVAILRRVSGGGTVLQGPGCLNYTLILRNGIDVPVGIGESFLFVLEHHKQCIRQMIGSDVEIAGVSDLVISGRKFSGNAQYRKRRFALLHGTFLLDLDLRRVSRYLRLPTRQPAYRQNRPHTDFIQNLHVDSQKLSSRLRELWQASDYFADVPRTRIAELAEHRYNRPQWTRKF
jgi:lipoate-protein ligase A